VAVNDGAAPSSGQVVLKDVLPPGVVVTSVASAAGVADTVQHGIAHVMPCTVTGTTVQTVECSAEEPVPIGDRVGAKVNVEVPVDASGVLLNRAFISGGAGGEASVATSTPVVAPSEAVPYGATVDVEVTGEDGQEVQAGGRPAMVSTIFATHVRSVSVLDVLISSRPRGMSKSSSRPAWSETPRAGLGARRHSSRPAWVTSDARQIPRWGSPTSASSAP
jgi:hypothetical protein